MSICMHPLVPEACLLRCGDPLTVGNPFKNIRCRLSASLLAMSSQAPWSSIMDDLLSFFGRPQTCLPTAYDQYI